MCWTLLRVQNIALFTVVHIPQVYHICVFATPHRQKHKINKHKVFTFRFRYAIICSSLTKGMTDMEIKLNEIFIAAEIFWGAENRDRWTGVNPKKVYETMERINYRRFALAFERAEIINSSFDTWKAFENDRTITWENGDVEPADIDKRVWGDHIRRPAYITEAA